MNLLSLFHGGGSRRKSAENWDDLQQKLSTAEARAKHVKGAYRYECANHVHPPFWAYSNTPIPCPWCQIKGLNDALSIAAAQNRDLDQQRNTAVEEKQRLERLLGEDAGTPGTEPIPAFADRPDFQPLPADPPMPANDEHLLTGLCDDQTLALPTIGHASDSEVTQQVPVAAHRNAMGLGATQTLPVVPAPVTAVLPLHHAPLPRITWGPGRDPEAAAVEAHLGTPAPTPEFAATAVPRDLPDLAHDKVHAALNEAS